LPITGTKEPTGQAEVKKISPQAITEDQSYNLWYVGVKMNTDLLNLTKHAEEQ